MLRRVVLKASLLLSVVMMVFIVGQVYAQTIPEEARRHFMRGMAAVETAKTPADYDDAIEEFSKAVKLAPNWAEAYYNLGKIQGHQGYYYVAIENLKKYLKLAPNAPDAEEVKGLIYKLEYKQDKRAKELLQKALREAEAKKKNEWINSLEGKWHAKKGLNLAYMNIDFWVDRGQVEAGVYTVVTYCLPAWYKGGFKDVVARNYTRIPVRRDGKNLFFKYMITRTNFYPRDRNCRGLSGDANILLSFKLSFVSKNLLKGTMTWNNQPPKMVSFEKEK